MDTTNNNGDDPFFLWRARATLLAPKMKLDAYLINEAIGIINTVLGESWLQAEGLRKDLGTVVPFRAHPIGNCLQAVWEPQVAELVELAEYLKFAARSQSFSKVAGCLRGDYASTRLQLAYAYRLHSVGAERVDFEPPVAAGRHGDIEFAYKGVGYLVECFVPREQVTGSPKEQLERLLKQSLDAVEDLSISVSIAIQLLRPIDVRDRKENVRCVQELGAELERYTKSSLSLPKALLRQTPSALISVVLTVPTAPGKKPVISLHPSFPRPNESPYMLMGLSWAPKSIAGVQASGHRSATQSHVGIWLSDKESQERSIMQDLEEPLKQLAKKLKKKTAQTKRGPEWGRLLLVQTWIASEFDRIRRDQLERFKKELFASSSLGAALLVSRKWDDLRLRHTWVVHPILPNDRQSDLWELLSQLSQSAREALVPQVAV
ncbi:hypothetical protein JQX13_39835 [Archangium violaceum]|uniref:hypothetical protein n=1 Tax=Archangium violaceum TaxID=83451 RepID=UPI00193B8B1D|nr:hypothetical protein [Archangium violaceum]QRK06213.1 hypothetical protein JQX13_39835 [Archangium violaceum]